MLVPLRILYSFVKPFVILFVDITSTLFDSSFDSFSTSSCFVFFEVTVLVILSSLSSKYVFLQNQQYHFYLLNYQSLTY